MKYCEYCKNKINLKEIYYKSDTVFVETYYCENCSKYYTKEIDIYKIFLNKKDYPILKNMLMNYMKLLNFLPYEKKAIVRKIDNIKTIGEIINIFNDPKLSSFQKEFAVEKKMILNAIKESYYDKKTKLALEIIANNAPSLQMAFVEMYCYLYK